MADARDGGGGRTKRQAVEAALGVPALDQRHEEMAASVIQQQRAQGQPAAQATPAAPAASAAAAPAAAAPPVAPAGCRASIKGPNGARASQRVIPTPPSSVPLLICPQQRQQQRLAEASHPAAAAASRPALFQSMPLPLPLGRPCCCCCSCLALLLGTPSPTPTLLVFAWPRHGATHAQDASEERTPRSSRCRHPFLREESLEEGSGSRGDRSIDAAPQRAGSDGEERKGDGEEALGRCAALLACGHRLAAASGWWRPSTQRVVVVRRPLREEATRAAALGSRRQTEEGLRCEAVGIDWTAVEWGGEGAGTVCVVWLWG